MLRTLQLVITLVSLAVVFSIVTQRSSPRENARGDRPHIYTGVKPCVNLLYFSSNEHVL